MFFKPITPRLSGFLAALLLPLLLAGPVAAAPVSRQQALDAAYTWLGLSPRLMHEAHGAIAGSVIPVQDALGQTAFYAVDLSPKGYVVIAADDAVEPVIAFSTTDTFQAVPGNPLYDMLRADVPKRITSAHARHGGTTAKWRGLLASRPLVLAQTSGAPGPGGSLSSVSDVRVAPLVQSQWDQLTNDVNQSQALYNYYTPPYGAGNPRNFYSGCVATMFAQIMRYHQWPQAGVGTGSFPITVSGRQASGTLLGGDGHGGSYKWSSMPLIATGTMSTTQIQAIGALLSDAGVASNMDYESDGSAAYITASVLTRVFGYANADLSTDPLSTLLTGIDASLDAGLPVALGINDSEDGHAVVADGYGYNNSTLYHHINMGWGGADNAWYNLPTIDAGGYAFNVVNTAVFNIDPSVSGEIVSGRIIDNFGNAVQGAVVTFAAGSTVVTTATTNAEGIYFAKGLSSYTSYTLTPGGESSGFAPASQSVTTGYSSSNGDVGDRTGINFTMEADAGAVAVTIDPGAVANGAQWSFNGGAWQKSGATVLGLPVGTGTLSFSSAKYWTTPPAQTVNIVAKQTTDVEVNYIPDNSLTAVPDDSNHGQVSANPAPGELGSYAPGTSVTLTATPVTGYYFAGWVESGTLVSTSATYVSQVKGARQLIADFPPDTLTGQGSNAYVTGNKTAVNIDVLSDLDATAGSLTIYSVTQPSNGTVTFANGVITFTPGSNFKGSTQFDYTASDGQGGYLTESVTIQNWFAASTGSYAGLALPGQITNGSSGYLQATVASSGALSGRLSMGGWTYNFSGGFDVNANFEKVIIQKDKTDVDLALHLNPAREITGTVITGGTTANIAAYRETYSNSNKAYSAGRYVILISGNSAVAGNGYAVVTISASGGVTSAGRLADGTTLSFGGNLNTNGSVPFYQDLYESGTNAGSFFGTITIQPAQAVQCTGTYAWFRPASTNVYYPGGFGQSGTVTGSLVPTGSSGVALKAHPGGSFSAEISGGGLVNPIDQSGQLLANGMVAWTNPGTSGLTIQIGTSGQLMGSFLNPATGRKVSLIGVWLVNQGLGGGYFLGNDGYGAVTLGQ